MNYSKLSKKIKQCTNCSLASFRRRDFKPFAGVGIPPTDVIIIDESISSNQELINRNTCEIVRFIKKMINDINQENNINVTYFFTYMTLCRSVNILKNEVTPDKENIAACSLNIMEIINIVKPKAAIFLSKEVEKYYKYVVKKYTVTLPPRYLIDSGGIRSPDYLTQYRKMEAFLKCL